MNKVFEIVETVCTSVLFVCIALAFFFRVVEVEGTSMYDTLNDKDRVVISYMSRPERGEIVVTDDENGTGKRLVKRVIAVGGDTIKIDYTTGEVYVNGELLDETYIYEPMETSDSGMLEMTISDGYCFLMGDNRNNSLDSRFDTVGQIKTDEIMGRVILRISPDFGKVS